MKGMVVKSTAPQMAPTKAQHKIKLPEISGLVEDEPAKLLLEFFFACLFVFLLVVLLQCIV